MPIFGGLRGVEAHDAGHDDSVGDAVGQVMERAKLVGHGVVDAQEGVGEGHTGHAGGVGHLLAGVRVLGAVLIAAGQVLKDELGSARARPSV